MKEASVKKFSNLRSETVFADEKYEIDYKTKRKKKLNLRFYELLKNSYKSL